MCKVALDLREITGNITLETPIFVTLYIGTFLKLPYKSLHYDASYHYEEIIRQIDLAPWPEINTPSMESEDNDLKRLIKFVSPFSSSSEWFNDSIIEAYTHLMLYSMNNDIPQIQNDKMIFGSKTHINPFKFNEIIVFRIIKSLGYIYDRYTTFEECCSFIERYYQANILFMKSSLLYTIKGIDNVTMLKIYNFVNSLNRNESGGLISKMEDELEIQKFSPSSDINREIPTVKRFQIDQTKLTFTFGELSDKKKLITKINATTAYEAIIVSAIKYDIDISSSSQPLKEFEALKKKTYIPVCPDFARRLTINRRYYTVSKNWSPNLLNPHIYTDEQLKSFVMDEGYNNKIETLSQREMISCLKATKKMTNFTIGIHPDCDIETTIMLTPLSSLNRDEIICMGIEDEETKQRLYSEIENESVRRRTRQLDKHKLQYISLSELVEYWRNEKVFLSPFSGEKIDSIVIDKFKRYCNKLIQEKSPCTTSAKLLLSTIQDLTNICKLLDSKLVSLKKKIKEITDEDIKENVQFFFQKCLEFSLYLRGWKVLSDNYPLNGSKIHYDKTMIMPRDRIPNKEMYEGFDYTAAQFVMDHSYIALQEALNVLKEIPEDLAMDIRQLYSLKFDNNKNKKEIMGMIFPDVQVNYKETLLDCMQNIFKGMKDTDSCMNTNSSWVMFSSAWYMTILGYTVPFNISDIEAVR